MLDVLDLTPHEQAAYRALVEMPSGTRDDVRSAAGLDDRGARAALRSLTAKGLVTAHHHRYAAVAPDVALEALFLAKEEQIKRARLYAERLASTFRAGSARRDPADMVEVVTGYRAVLTRSRQIQGSAREQVRGIDRPPYLKPHADLPNETESAALRRGVRFRVLYDPVGLAERHELTGDIARGLREGEEARVLPNAPIKMIIADNKLAWVPLHADPVEFVSMLVVHRSGLLEALCAMFEALWARALPLELPPDDPPDPAPDRPSADDRRLLALLTAGVPDNAAARQLGISPRTFQRRLHELMLRLGAQTRFQAGLQAGLLGWLTRPDDGAS